MPFLPPNQQRECTERIVHWKWYSKTCRHIKLQTHLSLRIWHTDPWPNPAKTVDAVTQFQLVLIYLAVADDRCPIHINGSGGWRWKVFHSGVHAETVEPDTCPPPNCYRRHLPLVRVKSCRVSAWGSCGYAPICRGGMVAEWLACWTQAQKGPGSNRSRDAVG